MNLNYDKIKAKSEHGGNPWTSYSDLFTVLSILFLLLYVVTNLRSGAVSIASRSAVQRTKQESEELKKQIKAYEVLRDDYVKKGASQEEIQVYQELMGKLNLLEDQAKGERDALYKQAQEAREKEESLNRYQLLVKNIITANLVSQANVKKRDNVIDEKEQVIGQKDAVIEAKEHDIDSLNRNIEQKKSEIDVNNKKIADVEDQLQQKIKEIKYAYHSKHKSEQKLQEAIQQITAQSDAQINALRSQNGQYVNQLQAAQGKIEEQNREAEKMLTGLSNKEQQYQNAIGELKAAHEAALSNAKKAYENGLALGTRSADDKLAQERAYRDGVEKQNKLYGDKLKGLQGDLDRTKNDMKGLAGKYQTAIGNLQGANDALKKDLAASLDRLNAQKKLAGSLKSGFAAAGLNADVDAKTGDVTVNFQGEYFDTGRSDLKNGMKNILEKLVPVYARSLFQDPKIAKKISAVEIVGFASPTYKGKYVNPDSLSQGDRDAVNYNMDLSYQRAKSIFQYVFDPNVMNFSHQKDLLPLVKVTGRSYLATDRIPGRDLSNVTNGEYCKMFDCKKSQKVIIKFHLMESK